jgi:hypothetical protein
VLWRDDKLHPDAESCDLCDRDSMVGFHHIIFVVNWSLNCWVNITLLNKRLCCVETTSQCYNRLGVTVVY